jgi:hypothetical protein
LTGINADLFGTGEQSEARLAMLIVVVCSTTQGHTRKLAQFVAARLRGCGHELQLHDAAHLDLPDVPKFDAALLLASVHLGRYQRSFIEFVDRLERETLWRPGATAAAPCRSPPTASSPNLRPDISPTAAEKA